MLVEGEPSEATGVISKPVEGQSAQSAYSVEEVFKTRGANTIHSCRVRRHIRPYVRYLASTIERGLQFPGTSYYHISSNINQSQEGQLYAKFLRKG